MAKQVEVKVRALKTLDKIENLGYNLQFTTTGLQVCICEGKYNHPEVYKKIADAMSIINKGIQKLNKATKFN